jgi:hypothetical protein
MKRSKLNALKDRIRKDHEKVSDMDILMAEIMKLPPGQLKRLLTDEVKAVLKKYGYEIE